LKKMEAAQAISLVTEFILWRNLDYPTEGLEADRFEAGWSVYSPVDVDESDPMAFLDMPVGRSVFLVGDSGRIEEVSSSVPPEQAQAVFTAQELADQRSNGEADGAESMAEFERRFDQADLEDLSDTTSSALIDAPPEEGALYLTGEATDAEASQLTDWIVQQLAQLGPAGWEEFTAVFAFTASSQIAQLRFSSNDRTGLVPVPQSIAELVRRQRELTARMPNGPWWRLLLTATNRGETTVDYDYGDEPFPDDQLVDPEHYRNDLEAYPRSRVPVWLAGYVGGPAVQGRDPRRAAAAVADDTAAGRTAIVAEDVPALGDLWARWTVLSAAYAGVDSGWGPRMYPGYAWYESDHRSGSTLFVLPGDRAVLSGGKWNSELLEAAYNGGEPLPDLYTGAPAWVNDSVLNTRNRNGLLTFCFWWANGQWHRGGTDTSDELDAPLPSIRTADETVRAMVSQTGPGTESQCEALLTAATDNNATRDDVAAILANTPSADLDEAVNQLSLAGLLAT
jgi:hypothetical protein